MQSLNNFSDHAPKLDWLRNFFDTPDNFMKKNSLGVMQKFGRNKPDKNFRDRT